MENNIPDSSDLTVTKSDKPMSGFWAFTSKWACAFPTIAAVFAIITEQAFFNRSAVWEMLRGTGDGG